MMRTGSCPNDRSFDRFLPEPFRLVSPEYWTPLAVAKRAADWLEDLGIRTVVDIGSGAGKFCVAGALFGRCRFIGLEQYSSLVTSAVALATCSISTIASALSRAHWERCRLRWVMRTYFFNPFGDYWLGADYPPEAGADVTGDAICGRRRCGGRSASQRTRGNVDPHVQRVRRSHACGL